jgi:hypothetical protein
MIVGGTLGKVVFRASGSTNYTYASSADSLIVSNYARSVATDGTIYVVGSNTGSNVARLIYSFNGNTWFASTTANAIFAEGSVTGLAYSNGLFMGVGIGNGSGRAATSSDGVTWTAVPQTFSLGSGLFCVAGNNQGTWVVAGGTAISNLFVSTNNGSTFSTIDKGDGTWLNQRTNSIVYGGDRFVGVGATNKRIAVSYDGVTWTGSTNDNSIFDGELFGVDYNGTYFVAVGAGTNKVGYSTDGFNWSASTAANSILVSTAFTVHWDGNKWYVGAFDNTGIIPGKWLITSTDLSSWTLETDSALGNLGTAIRAIASI